MLPTCGLMHSYSHTTCLQQLPLLRYHTPHVVVRVSANQPLFCLALPPICPSSPLLPPANAKCKRPPPL